ncbi:MAG: hypothetical protein V5A64_07040 [Candidatus Thermoplasmatota archaeon]
MKITILIGGVVELLKEFVEKIKEWNIKDLEKRKKEAREKPVRWQICMIAYALTQVGLTALVMVFTKELFVAVVFVFLLTVFSIYVEHDMYKIYREANRE